MPADVRALAQEAVELAEKAQPYQLWVMQSTHELAKAFSRHAGTHYATLARALLEALDERDEARRNYQFMVDRVADEKLDGYRELGSRAASAENDRDKILAALPHALRSCGCEQKLVMRQRPGDRYERPAFEWPEQHEAAIEWLQGRIK